MVPNAGEIVRRRCTVTTILRLCALLMAVVSFIPLISWLSEGISDGDLMNMSYYLGRIVVWIVMLFTAVAMFLGSTFFARIAVPVRRHMHCPGCKYRIEGLVDARCTECGLPLTKDFIEHEPLAARMNAQRPYRILVFRERVAWFFRIAGVFGLLIGLLYLAGSVVAITQWYIEGWGNEYASYYAGQAISSVFATAVINGFALFMLIATKRLARFCVPYRGIDAEP